MGGGGGGKGSTPAVPNYSAAAGEQGYYNLLNSITSFGLSNPNVFSPYGSVTYGDPQLNAELGIQGGAGPSYMPTESGGVSMTPGLYPSGGSPSSGGGFTPPNFNPTSTGNSSDPWGQGTGVTGINNQVGNTLGINPDSGAGMAYSALTNPLGMNKGGSSGGEMPMPNLPNIYTTPGQMSESVNLSPQEQALLNSQQSSQLGLSAAGNNILGAMGNVTGQLNTAALPNATQGADSINNNVVNALYNQQTQYLDPQFSQEQSQLQSQMAAQGLNSNDTSYGNAMTNFNNQKQQAYGNAMESAQAQGTQAGLAATQENIGGANLGMQEQQLEQMMPLQEIQQILGMTSPQMPVANGMAGASTAQSPNLMEALQSQYAGQLGNYNAQAAQSDNTMSTLGSLGMLAYMMM